jgi:hypothetical protein
LRDVGDSGERLLALAGDRGGSRGLELAPLDPEPSPSPSGETSRVLTVKSGVPGRLPFPGLFPTCAISSWAARPLPATEPCPVPGLSVSTENRTWREASVDTRDAAGRGAFSTAEVRAAGVSIVYDSVLVSAALRVAGDSSSSSCEAE